MKTVKDPSPKDPARVVVGRPAPTRRGFSPQSEAQSQALEVKLNRLAELKWDKSRLENEQRELSLSIRELEGECATEMDKIGMKNAKYKEAAFVRTHKTEPSVVDEDALFADLKKRKLDSVIKTSVGFMALVGLCNEMEKTGAAPLDGVTIYKRPTVTVKRVGGARVKG